MSQELVIVGELPDRRKKLIKRYLESIPPSQVPPISSPQLKASHKPAASKHSPHPKIAQERAPIPLPEIPTVAIVGGGISGLSLAYLLEQTFGDKKFDVTLFESQKDIGGRIHTVHFKDTSGNDLPDQFAELGAMRLPDGTNDVNFERITTAVRNLKLQLIDWHSPGNPSYINYELRQSGKAFTLGELITFNPIPLRYMNMTPGDLNGDIMDSYLRYFTDAHSVELGLDKLLADHPSANQWSYRDALRYHIHEEYLRSFQKLNPLHLNAVDLIIDQIELVESATGLLNLAWVEAVIDTYTFANKLKTVSGGLSQITTGIHGLLTRTNVLCNHRVFKVDEYVEGQGVVIHWQNLTAATEETRAFDLVFVTVPFSALRNWSFSKSLSRLRRNYIRQLNYDNSAKIYVLWPEKVADWASAKIIGVAEGATLVTDLMIRKIVYPANSESDRVTLFYTWAQDALAWGALNDVETLKLIVRQVNEIHGTNFDPAQCQILKKTWTDDPNYFGAFSLYSPTQFMALTLLQEPEWKYDGRLFFAGEHLSYNHAWIAGAVDSSYRALRKLAKRQNWTFQTSQTIFERTPIGIH